MASIEKLGKKDNKDEGLSAIQKKNFCVKSELKTQNNDKNPIKG